MSTFLRQRGFSDLPIIRRLSNSTVKLMQNITVILSLDFFSEVQNSFLKINVLFGSTLYNNPVCSVLKIAN